MLTFTYIEHVKGNRPIYNTLTGEQIRVITELRALYDYDGSGLLLCRKGYLPRLQSRLQEFGCEVELQSLDEPFPPEVYEEDWENVLRKFKFRPAQETCLVQ